MTPAADVAQETSPPSSLTSSGPRASLLALRVVVSLHALLAVGQPVLAGRYLNGTFDALGHHAFNASLIIVVDMVQFTVAVIYCWAGKGRALPALLSFGLYFAEGLQTGMGYERNLAVHIPLGVAIVVTQLFLAVWVWREEARRPRTWALRGKSSTSTQARSRP